VLAAVAGTGYGAAQAASEWSPELRIVALEVTDGVEVLRLGVRRRIETGAGPLGFNPADCATATAAFRINGTATTLEIFDLPLGATGRSRVKQQQLLNDIYAAFATSRMVELRVRDDLCLEATGSPYVAGVRVRH